MKHAKWTAFGLVWLALPIILWLPSSQVGSSARAEARPAKASQSTKIDVTAIAEGIFTGPVGIVVTVSAVTPESSFSRDTPFNFETGSGNSVTLQAPVSTTVNGRALQFVEWRSGETVLGTAPRLVRTISGPQTFTAVYNPACCRLIFTAQQDTGAGLTVALNFEQPARGTQSTPVAFDVPKDDRLRVTAPATVGNLRFQHWLSLTENTTLSQNRTLEGGIDRAITIAAVYKLDCTLVAAPTVAINAPQNNLEVINDNSFSIEGIIRAEQPPVTVKVEAMSDSGELNSVSIAVTGATPDFSFFVPNLTGLLYPGRNVVKVRAEGLCGKLGETAIQITFIAPFKPPTLCSASKPTTQTIRFGEYPVGSAISTQYTGAFGLIFPTPSTATAPTIENLSGNQVLQARPKGVGGMAQVSVPLVAQFFEPQKRVKLLGGVVANGGISATLKAYNQQYGGQLVAQDGPKLLGSGGATFEVTQSAQGDIYRIEFELTASGVQYIDNLEFERECAPKPLAQATLDLSIEGMEITQATNRLQTPQDRPASDAFFNKTSYSGVPLIKDRFTVVRVYAGLRGNTLPVTHINARLYGYKGSGVSASEVLGELEPLAGFYGPAGQTITLDPLEPVSDKRAEINHSWNFLLPLAWTEAGPIKLVAEINRPATVTECAASACLVNNEYTVYDISFVQTHAIQVLPVPVTINKGQVGQLTTPTAGADCTFQDINAVTADPTNPAAPLDRCALDRSITVVNQRFSPRAGFFQRVYPVREGGVLIKLSPGSIARKDSPETNPDFIANLLDDIRDKFGPGTYFGFIPKAGGRAVGTFYYGLVPVPVRGIAYRESSYALGSVGAQNTAAHETGHTIGLKHASDDHHESSGGAAENWPYPHGGIGEFGFDTQNWAVISPGYPPAGPHAHELMSYGGGGDDPQADLHTESWTSPRNYCRVIKALGGGSSEYCDDQTKAAVSEPQPDLLGEQTASHPSQTPTRFTRMAQTQQRYLVIRGRIHSQGNAEFLPFYQMLPAAAPETPPNQGSYSLELQDRNGQILFTQKFDPEVVSLHEPPPFVSFLQFVPFSSDTERVVLKRDNLTLAMRTRSANTPTVQVLTPNGGEIWIGTGTRLISWQAQDADSSDTLVYTVEYSQDGGQTWATLARDLTETSYEIDAAELPGGDQALVRVLATDGFNTGQDQSDLFFKVAKKPPTLAILGLRDSEGVIPNNIPRVLTATGTDLEDGPLPDEAFNWTIADGNSINGRYLNLQTLQPGQYRITLTAKDRDGQEASVILPRPLTIIPGKVAAPTCCALSFVALQDNGATLPASFNVLTPISASRATPFTLSLAASDRVGVSAPAMIGNLRFLHWRSITSSRVLTTSTTLNGSVNQNETLAAIYQLPAVVTFNVTSICEGCVTGPAQFPGLTVNVVTPTLGSRATPFNFEATLNSRAVLTAPLATVFNGKTLRFKHWASVTDGRIITTNRTLAGYVDKAETVAAVYQ